ncbi:HNH endonuclease [Salmonella enterica subsp. enterica serovar Javiana]|nr:HNH endonuclease [Salmonella enterica]ECT9264846.1 HNH endonuclease [Salmonella enterica subsp. enterica serovar Javiana]
MTKFSDLFDYDAELGILKWRTRVFEETKGATNLRGSAESKTRRWNSRYAGKPAGTKRDCRHTFYITIEINTKPHMAHRIIWEMHNGAIPQGFEVDHIDRDGTNNRLENLRIVDRSGNMKNKGRQANASGVHGVYWNKSLNKYVAQCRSDGKKYVKYCTTLDEAKNAIQELHLKHKFHPNHGK